MRATMVASGTATFKPPERLVAVGEVDKKALRADIAALLTAEQAPAERRAG